MVKKVQSSLEDSAIRELSVTTDPTNEDSTRIKRKIWILDHPKNLINVLCTRLTIVQGLIGNYITTGPNQYRFTQTFLDGEALRIFDFKSTELRQKTIANLIIIMNHFVAYFVPKECLSNKKIYIRYKIKKHCKLATRQYVGLVCDLNARMAQMPPLFDENQQLDESGLVDSLTNKVSRSHKAMLISQGFNPETGDLETFLELCERAETMHNIYRAKFDASERSVTPRDTKSTPSSKNRTKW